VQDYHQLDIWQRAMAFAVFVTGLELCERLYPSLPGQPHPVTALIDEGNQIARMTHTLLQRLTPRTHNSKLKTQNS